jgi:GPI mannosyltransferase 3
VNLRALLLDTSWAAFAKWVALGSLLFHLLVAYRSQGFYQCDEHFQVVEFVSLKLGWSAPADLPWEYGARGRSWLQPALFYPFARAFVAAGFEDPLGLAWLLRTLSALLGWAGLCAMARCLPRFLEDGTTRRCTLLAVNFFYLVPLLDARTSGENFSQAFALFALALLVAPGRLGAALYPSDEGGQLRAFEPAAWLAGTCFGLSFLSRYQAGALVMGCCLWFLVYGRSRLSLVVSTGGGLLVTLLAGVLIDRWGYGEWVYAPWNYFRLNLLEGVSARFGVSPVWGFVTLYATKLLPPLGLAWLAVFAISAFALPRHLLTWTTLPFLAMHHAIGHKEARFLFPALVFGLVLAGLLVERARLRLRARPEARGSRLARRLAPPGFALLAAVNLAGLALNTLMPTSPRWTLLGELDRIAPDGYTVYTGNGFDVVSTCGARPAFYWGKRRWAAYRSEEMLRTRDERGLPAFYGWAGTPRTIAQNPFSARCREVAPKLWVSSPKARSAWQSDALAGVAKGITTHAVYRCDETAQSSR